MGLLHAAPRRWTVEEYYRMAEAGILSFEERMELIDGEVLPLSGHDKLHADTVAWATNRLVAAYGATHLIRPQLPFQVGDYSEPEPDFALVRPEVQQRARRHPTVADLILEVSYTSLNYDRSEKMSLYARAGVAEYWILNLVDRCLEVHLEPHSDPTAVFGWSYAVRRVLSEEEHAKPVSLAGPALRVGDLFAPEPILEDDPA